MDKRLWPELTRIADEEVRRLLDRLPPALREPAAALPVGFAPRPSRQAVSEDGVAPDTLGLFLGEAFPDAFHAGCDLPAQIILYLENIHDEAGGDEALYREELRKTLLHELGHYLGLDEDDLEQRHLE